MYIYKKIQDDPLNLHKVSKLLMCEKSHFCHVFADHATALGLTNTVIFPPGRQKTKQSKNKTVIVNKHQIQNVPKWSEDLASY